ncbi:hypothetical protein [Reyranella sp.]|uniref:hypothetical protein n=1 Tax=Reyranella sp. TaxID=1929291 RepID=UPI003D14DCE9
MTMPGDRTALSARKGPVLLALAAGPLLGAAIFFSLAGPPAPPPPVQPDAKLIAVPWHHSTRLTALQQVWTGPDIVDVLTRRDAKTGTTYVLRRIWCTSREFQVLGEGATEAQAKAGHAADIGRKPVAEKTISFYVAAHICPGWKTK